MKVPQVPVELKLALLAVVATLGYTFVGQLVPQKEVHPPEVVEIAQDVTPEQMAGIGKQIFDGKGICTPATPSAAPAPCASPISRGSAPAPAPGCRASRASST